MNANSIERLADGVLETRDDGRQVIRFERRIGHPIERVWDALTRPEEMIAWWGRAEVELVEGGRFAVRWLNSDDEGNVAVMYATVTRIDPPRLLETDGDMHGVLRWELEPAGEETVLRFSSTLELPEQHRTKVLAGWHFHLDALAAVLDGGAVDLVNVGEGGEWERIHGLYVERSTG